MGVKRQAYNSKELVVQNNNTKTKQMQSFPAMVLLRESQDGEKELAQTLSPVFWRWEAKFSLAEAF